LVDDTMIRPRPIFNWVMAQDEGVAQKTILFTGNTGIILVEKVRLVSESP